MSDVACPMCRDGILERGEGRLDQSGNSFLPTVALRCPRCEYARFQPAVHARWVSAISPPAEVKVAPRTGATAKASEAVAEALAA